MIMRDHENAIEKVIIRSTGNSYFNGGNLGIGTNSPNYLFDIKVNSDNMDAFRISHPNSPNAAGFMIGFGQDYLSNNNSTIDFKIEYSSTDYKKL